MPEEPSAPLTRSTVPEIESQPFDIHEVIDGLLDDDSFFEIKPLFAAELVTGFGRMGGETVGIVANNSAVKGGVLFADSADKAARFIWLCDAFSIPLVYLADVPGFMIGSEVERGGIIRHGAKMITAVSEATVPQFSVIVRKAYGAGLYAMAGPGFGPDASLALPTARIAVMGPEAAVNAVYANKIDEIADLEERERVRPGPPARVRGGRRPRAAGRRPRAGRHRGGGRAAYGAAAPPPLRRAAGPRLQRAPTRRAARLRGPVGARRRPPPGGVCGGRVGCERRHLVVKTLVPQAHSRYLGGVDRCAGLDGRDTSRSLLIFSPAQQAKPRRTRAHRHGGQGFDGPGGLR